MTAIDLTDRKNIFYWQTDRKLTPEDYSRIFLKRHEVTDEELITILERGITTIPGKKHIAIIPADAGILKGNVNIVRKVTINDKPFVVRIHPKGVKNGYFFAEKVALDHVQKVGVPAPIVLEVHTATDENDMDFILMTISQGTNMDVYLHDNPANEKKILFDAGMKLAKIHSITVQGFGAFDNEIAKTTNALVGLHPSYHDFIHTGLKENLTRLIGYRILTQKESDLMENVFETTNYEPINGPRLIHNDYADWNLLTDGNLMSGALDWDECHAGDPIADLACWSTFYSIERLPQFLKGYTSITTLPADFDKRFHFYRLRYTISKMALRAKRYSVDKSEFIKIKLDLGKLALAEELEYCSLNKSL
jgi:aminoglycoside phosphotransferase (APT) family kinase protein